LIVVRILRFKSCANITMSEASISDAKQVPENGSRHFSVRLTQALKQTSDQAKASSSILKFGIERFEWLSSPVVSRLAPLSDPLLNHVDSSIGFVQGKLLDALRQKDAEETKEEEKAPVSPSASALSSAVNALQLAQLRDSAYSLVHTQWFVEVDKILGISNKASVEQAFHVFYRSCQDAFFPWNADCANVSTAVSQTEFLATLNSSLSLLWSPELERPAVQFYRQAHKKFAQLREASKGQAISADDVFDGLLENLGESFRDSVTSTFHSSLSLRAKSLYLTALHAYLNLYHEQSRKALLKLDVIKDNTEQARILLVKFIERVRTQLGHEYNDHLEAPLLLFFQNVKNVAVQDLHALKTALDQDQDGHLSLSDVFGSGRQMALRGASSVAVGVSHRVNGVLDTSKRVTHHVSDTLGSVTQVVSHFTTDLTNEVLGSNAMQNVLSYSLNTFDRLLPPSHQERVELSQAESKDKEKKTPEGAQDPISLSQVRSRVSRRLRCKAASGAQQIKTIGNLANDVMNADLFACAAQVLDVTSQHARPAYDQVHERLEKAVNHAKQQLEELRETLAQHKLSVSERVSPIAKDVRSRLEAVMSRARQGQHYVYTNAVLPTQTSLVRFSQSTLDTLSRSALLSTLVALLTTASELAQAQLANHHEVEALVGLLKSKIQGLWSSVKDVFFWSSWQGSLAEGEKQQLLQQDEEQKEQVIVVEAVVLKAEQVMEEEQHVNEIKEQETVNAEESSKQEQETVTAEEISKLDQEPVVLQDVLFPMRKMTQEENKDAGTQQFEEKEQEEVQVQDVAKKNKPKSKKNKKRANN